MTNNIGTRMGSPILVTAILLLGCLMPFATWTEAQDLKTLTGGATEASLVFEAAGENVTQSLTMPKHSIVTSASMDLRGDSLLSKSPVTVEHDFNDTHGNAAFWGASNVQAAGLPTGYQANQFPDIATLNISKSDDVYLDTANIQNMYAYHSFKFGIPGQQLGARAWGTILSIKVVWEGGGVATSMIGNGGANVYLYNNYSGQWEMVGNFACGDVWCERTISNTFTQYGDRYPDENGTFYVLATTRSAGNTNRITTDFVKVQVVQRIPTWPDSPAVDIGDDGQNEWSMLGQYSVNETFSGGVLVDELNERIAAAGQGQGDVVIPIAVTSKSEGIFTISKILIQFSPDEPPYLKINIPSNWSLKEDTDAPNLIDLYDYFDDDRDTTLTFSIVNKSAPNSLDATIGNTGKMSFTTPAENWWGVASFIVRATDSGGNYVDSNQFDVTVTSVNDPPVFDPVPTQHVKEGTPYHFFIHATDVDIALNPKEHITYSSDNRLVVANAVTGEVTLVDLNDSVAVGSVIPDMSVNFSATDTLPSITNITVNFSIENLEFPPVLEHIGNRSLMQNVPFVLQLKATDRDTKDVLTFSSEGDLFTVPSSGLINFTPRQEDVGDHSMVLKVSDGELEDTDTVLFRVVDVNDAPTLEAMPDQKADNRHEFVYKVPAKDKDPKDELTFSTDSNQFKINSTTGEVRFWPKPAMAGSHTIKISVVDRLGLGATGYLTINISVVNGPPTVTITSSSKMPMKPSSKVTLTAVATDPDGDKLTYRWYKASDPATTLGTNSTLAVKSQKSGQAIYGVDVSDGIAITNKTFTLSVKKSSAFIPGFDGGLTIWVVALVAMALVALRRRK